MYADPSVRHPLPPSLEMPQMVSHVAKPTENIQPAEKIIPIGDPRDQLLDAIRSKLL
jgi:hypothetical protein